MDFVQEVTSIYSDSDEEYGVLRSIIETMTQYS